MTVTVEKRPLVVHQVTSWPFPDRRGPEWCELRNATMRITTCLIGASVADLDVVHDARSLADIKHCPACYPHQAA